MGLKCGQTSRRRDARGFRLALAALAWGLLVPCLGPPAGLAKEPSRAIRALYEEARQAYDAGDFPEAAKLLESAYRLEPDPALLWNIGRSYERARDYPKAIDAYSRFATEAETAQERAEARQKLIEVKADFGKGWLTVRSEARGARVAVDGGVEVAPPLVRELLEAGQHRITVSAPGKVTQDALVTIAAGEETEVTMTLQAGASELVGPERGASSGSSDALRTWGWVSLGVGGAAAVAGAALLGVAHHNKGRVDGASTDDAGVVTGISRRDALSTRDAMRVQSAAGVGLLAGGGAGLVAGVTMLLLAPRDEDPQALSLQPELGGFSVRGSF